MQLKDLVACLPVEMLTPQIPMEVEVTGGYISDLLSNAMAQAGAGAIWITMQGHQNIIAVASLVGMSGIIVVGGAAVDPETIHRAQLENVPLLRTESSAFVIAGRLHACGLGSDK